MANINRTFLGKANVKSFIQRQHVSILGYADIGIQHEFCHLSSYPDGTFHTNYNDLSTANRNTNLTAVYETAAIITNGLPTYGTARSTSARYPALKSFSSTSITALNTYPDNDIKLFSGSKISSISLPNCLSANLATLYNVPHIADINMPKLRYLGPYNFDLYFTQLIGRKWAFPELEHIDNWTFEHLTNCALFLPKLKQIGICVCGNTSTDTELESSGNIFFLGSKPPELADYSNGFRSSNSRIVVPKGAAAAYRADSQWAACIALNGHEIVEADDLSAAWQQELG